MGREIRRVPFDWQHPTRKEGETTSYQRVGDFIPLLDNDIQSAYEEWQESLNKWLLGTHQEQIEHRYDFYDYAPTYAAFVEREGRSPDPDCHRARKWHAEEATAYQIYETVTEGTPVSPVFPDEAAMIAWLIEQGHSEHVARDFLRYGSVPSGVVVNGSFADGIDVIEKMAEIDRSGDRLPQEG
jgi:hypothetical protein